jgi:hypothetical protein
MYTTLVQFVTAVNMLDDVSDAYDVFEFKSSNALRDLIYTLAEPFRSAMHTMGFTNY